MHKLHIFFIFIELFTNLRFHFTIFLNHATIVRRLRGFHDGACLEFWSFDRIGWDIFIIEVESDRFVGPVDGTDWIVFIVTVTFLAVLFALSGDRCVDILLHKVRVTWDCFSVEMPVGQDQVSIQAFIIIIVISVLMSSVVLIYGRKGTIERASVWRCEPGFVVLVGWPEPDVHCFE